MPADLITRAEQERRGLIRSETAGFVPGRDPGHRDLSDTDRSLLSSALGAAGDMMAHRQQTHHAGSEDSALTVAFASLFYSLAYGVALLFITGGLLIAGWMMIGGDGQKWLIGWLVLWGICCLVALAVNRWQGLHFTPAGIAHAEIDSRERVALAAINRHADIIEKRLGLAGDDTKMIDVSPVQRRIAG